LRAHARLAHGVGPCPARVHGTWANGPPLRPFLLHAGLSGSSLLTVTNPDFIKPVWGEQRVVELSDHSHIALDARTRLRVRFSADARVVQLLEGQAQFSVAKDPARPFKVEAGSKTIVAVGTVFDVEYVDSQVHVAMVEGKVAVLSHDPSGSAIALEPNSMSSDATPIELNAGEALAVRADGASTVLPKADIEAATAWRE